jgi:hypothetical protein
MLKWGGVAARLKPCPPGKRALEKRENFHGSYGVAADAVDIADAEADF